MTCKIDEEELARDFKNSVNSLDILAWESKKINENLHLIYVEKALANERLFDSKKDITKVQNDIEELTRAMEHFASQSDTIVEFLLNLGKKINEIDRNIELLVKGMVETNSNERLAEVVSTNKKRLSINLIDISSIQFSEPELYKEERVYQLAKLILKLNGIVTPLIVEKIGLEKYRVVNNYLGYWAAVKANKINNSFKMIEAIIISDDKDDEEHELIFEQLSYCY